MAGFPVGSDRQNHTASDRSTLFASLVPVARAPAPSSDSPVRAIRAGGILLIGRLINSIHLYAIFIFTQILFYVVLM
jgi:hypothetical protein